MTNSRVRCAPHPGKILPVDKRNASALLKLLKQLGDDGESFERILEATTVFISLIRAYAEKGTVNDK